ncbi:MAG: hypothetical protein JWQ38_1062 [Flavipsychrobacter sp.]|nr:hypothetical protein [Flavipsychrobacter sp.]
MLLFKKLTAFLLTLIIPACVFSQVLPKEGRKLHYRIIGFATGKIVNAEKYDLEIASGYYNSEDSFSQNIIITQSGKESNMIAEVPSFNTSYTWRISHTAKNKMTPGVLHHLSTGTIQDVDTNIVRFRVIQPAAKYNDAFVFLDANKALYDMNGHAVWYLPDVFGKLKNNQQLVDLKMTSQGTISFMLNNDAYEMNYDGDILWKAPNNGIVSGDTVEHYHHEFTRLGNGHYMILSSENVVWKLDDGSDNVEDSSLPLAVRNKMKADSNLLKSHFGTVIEYDGKGNVVWSWRSSPYFMASDIKYFNARVNRKLIDVHQNSFYFDEQHKYIYVGFKNISRVLKVSYPQGKVVASYGETFRKGIMPQGNGLFYNQHAAKISHDGYLYLYNNNNAGSDSIMPTIIMMKEPTSPKDGLKKVWEYTCNIEGIENNPLFLKMKRDRENTKEQHPEIYAKMRSRPHPTSGGNVIELPDHSFFVSMNNEFSKVFIVDRDKKTLWSAVAEKWNAGERQWSIMLQYRASIITDRSKLEQMIWHTGKTTN